MPVMKRFFGGGMDLDSSPYRVGNDAYLEAFDISRDARRGDGDVQVTGFPGNQLVPYALPAGTNKCIGAASDPLRKCVYYFVWNENFFHSVLRFNVDARTVDVILQSRTNSATDVDFLQFQPNSYITSVNVLHRDEGDLLFFIDSNRKPRQVDISKAVAGWYAGRATIENTSLAKQPPLDEPAVVYQDEIGVTVNNLKKDLFQFTYRFEYDDFSQSTYSAYSKMPIPDDYLNPDTESSPSKNSVIRVTVQTGGPDVKKIRIAARSSNGSVYTDLFEVAVLDKDALGISDNTTYIFSFRNDGTYYYVNKAESILLYSWVPDQANAMELANGSVLVFGGITEGRNMDCVPDITPTVTTQVAPSAQFDIIPMYNWYAKYKFGIAYYDENNKTPGVISTAGLAISMPPYTENSPTSINIPSVRFEIRHQPPVWAKTMRWTRTRNLSQTAVLYWITAATDFDSKYAYLDITNLDQYIKENPSTASVLAYNFAEGDRVRFVKRLSTIIGQPNTFATADYLIEGKVTDPFVNGVTKTGTFIKIKVPPIGSGLGFGPPPFSNYVIMIYRPTQNISAEGEIFFEFGESYPIIDPGTSQRRHSGQNGQNQSDPSLGFPAPAVYEFTEGDYYLRQRSIEGSRRIEYRTVPSATDFETHTIPVSFQGTNNPSNGYTGQNVTIGSGFDQNILNNASRAFLLTNREITGRFIGKIDMSIRASYPYKVKLRIYRPVGGILTEIVVIPGTDAQTYNSGQNQFDFDIPVTIPANARVYFLGQTKIVNSGQGRDISYNVTDLYFSESQTADARVPSESFSDNYLSKVSSNGRPLSTDDDSARNYNPTMVRFGGEYPQGGSINQLPLFFPENVDEYDRSFGDIMRLRLRDRYIRVYQKYKVGTVPIFQQVIKDAVNGDVLAQSDKLLNNIQYYSGDFGIGECPESLAANNYADYFVDNNRGVICRLSGDGISVLSILYKANAWATEELASRGSLAKAIGVYDAEANRYILHLQASSRPAVTITFHEPSKQFESFLRLYPDTMVCYNTLLIAFQAGTLWTHDSATYCNYFGQQYFPIVKAIFNDGADFRKSFQSINIVGNKKWLATLVETSLGQQSRLELPGDWKKLEDGYSASFYRDTNSPGGLMRGDTLKGNWISVTLEAETGDTISKLVTAGVSYIESNKNIR